MTEKQHTLADELERLHEDARGCEFDLVPADGPIARLSLFMHENGERILAALRQSAEAVPSDATLRMAKTMGVDWKRDPKWKPAEAAREVVALLDQEKKS